MLFQEGMPSQEEKIAVPLSLFWQQLGFAFTAVAPCPHCEPSLYTDTPRITWVEGNDGEDNDDGDDGEDRW